MAPNLFGNSTLLLAEGTLEKSDPKAADSAGNQSKPANTDKQSAGVPVQKTYKKDYVWRNIIVFVYLHMGSLYGIYLLATGKARLATFFLTVPIGIMGAFGITAGAHRLWAHKSYKARTPLRILLMLLQTLAFQNSIYEWVRDHRVHHKFTDTDADPHNASRGFFFSHIGWLLIKKHPDVKIKGSTIDMSDLERDPVVMFQKRFYLIMMPLLSFILPSWAPWYFLGESFSNSWYISSVLRYMISVHLTWLVNSAAHIWGMKPYDKSIKPTNNIFVAIFALGEGWHNYHHVFPWDYKTSEFSRYRSNLTAGFIDLFSRIGLAYDLKTVSEEVITKRILRTGDGSHDLTKRDSVIRQLLFEGHDDVNNNNYKDNNMIWGWDDADMTDTDKKYVKILHQKAI